MQLNLIKIRNFLSIKSIDLSFNESNGLILVEGKNLDSYGSNGSGKSSIFEAIYWCLTGKTLRKSTEETLINVEIKKNLSVELISDKFRIVRSKKPTALNFFVGKTNLTKASSIETQTCIDEFLSSNYKLLAASMFLGQHNDLTFLDSTPEEKRTIIRNFLNLENVFLLRDKIKDFKSDYLNESKKCEAIVKELFFLRDNKKSSLTSIDKDLPKYSKFEGVNLDLNSILEEEKFNETLEKRNRDLKIQIQTLSKKISLLEKSKTEKVNRIEECELCGNKKELPPANENDFSSLIKELDLCMIEVENTLNLKQIPFSSKEYANFLNYKKLAESKKLIQEEICSLEHRIQELDKVRIDVLEKYEVMKFWEKAFSEHGIIKYIIKNILHYFNSRCKFYLSLLTNGKYFIEFDEELNEKISINGLFIHYISLSGGEKRKINLAVLLALKDLLIITNKSPSNLLFFDEITDSIDDEGMANVRILLNELKRDKLIFLITHNDTLKKSLDVTRKINVIKKDGESYINEQS